MKKSLVADQEKCTGCRLCEMVCSVNKHGASDPCNSRIHIIKWENEGFYLPMFCQHCDEPLCEAVCPVNAVERNEELGSLSVNHEACIGCKACISTCPLGGVAFHDKEGKVLRCDLCDGDPTCIKYCDTKAIKYIDNSLVHIRKKRSAAEKLYKTLKKQ